MGNLSFLSAWSNSSPSLVYRPCALAGAARLQRLSEAEPLDGSFVRGAKTWAPRAGARARSLTLTLSLRLLDLRRGVTRPQEAYNISRMPLCVTSAYVCTRPNRHTAPLVQYQTYLSTRAHLTTLLCRVRARRSASPLASAPPPLASPPASAPGYPARIVAPERRRRRCSR